METNVEIHDWVRRYYGEVLGESGDLATNACCATGTPSAWLQRLLANVHDDVQRRFYGCGFPIPEALDGATVLDLGCGTGRDVYLLAQLVGERGRVIGVDMTPAQLDVARRSIGWHTDRFGYARPNVTFHQGYIEDLASVPIASGSADVVVSNCVVNLSPRKDLVLAEAARVLRDGGEMYFSDVFADRRLPNELATDPLLYAECLGGAMYRPDFLSLARRHGFLDPRVVSEAPIEITSEEISARVGAARFYSVTLRLYKLPQLEERCEDYGQIATYRGTIPHTGALFRLDAHHLFEAGRPERVCGNTAEMLASTRLAPHFDLAGTQAVHFGPFDCSSTMAHDQYAQPTGVTPAPACC